jgi:hypothetical protein
LLRHLAAFVMTSLAQPANAVEQNEWFEINTELMEATFQGTGPSAKQPGEISGGTVFLMGKPIDETRASFVLITAAHVLDDISGDTLTINFRWKNQDGTYGQKAYGIPIRENGKDLFVKHPSVDVAALYTKMPIEFKAKLLPIALIGSDDYLVKYEIHPGDELLCLGYPLFASGEHEYPILRSGKIASYPLIPTKTHKNWLFDFRVFPGNSGGPVYFVDRNRVYGPEKATHIGETIQFLAGLVTAQVNSTVFKDKDLSLGVIIPAPFIRETLDLLPEKSPYQ